jgi:hypothetical protein
MLIDCECAHKFYGKHRLLAIENRYILDSDVKSKSAQIPNLWLRRSPFMKKSLCFVDVRVFVTRLTLSQGLILRLIFPFFALT